ncbi:MAG: 16S rRNA (guanine(966)-N(2))-methyltransferase RsmD [Alphaproteobacteria bacterium]
MRIVGGRHRGRRLVAPRGSRLRPTSDRLREVLFDILAHRGMGSGGSPSPRGQRVLDAFAGTGALGLEALSRGAEHATFMETERQALECIRRNAAALGEDAHVDVRAADATNPPPASPGEACALALLDPPYGSDLARPALTALAQRGWLAPGAVVVLEEAAPGGLAVPAGFETLDRRVHGDAALVFLRRVTLSVGQEPRSDAAAAPTRTAPGQGRTRS